MNARLVKAGQAPAVRVVSEPPLSYEKQVRLVWSQTREQLVLKRQQQRHAVLRQWYQEGKE